ncbi:MAG: hypothetical protein ACD_60C00149G0035 [uncultured bacterium]|nr:MAG: hypothetical protein ACD_60C00149G0035 [uncultured bacterium]
MILLDTNIISEMMKQSPSIKILKWIDQQEVIDLFITTITIAEISYGIYALPKGNRRSLIENSFNQAIQESFKHRILSFDEASAHFYGKLMAHRKKLGRPLSILDGQIAAIALTQGAAIATRNVRDFAHCNLDLINPFE